MGMKSRSGHFNGTNGYNTILKEFNKFPLNIQLFASKYQVPNTPKVINIEKQTRHLDGTPGKSQLIISMEECKILLTKFSGKGTMVCAYQEKVNFNKIIGLVEINGVLKYTTWGKIHYSKTGCHIVPIRN